MLHISFSFTKSEAAVTVTAKYSAYSLTEVFAQIYFIYNHEVPYFLLWKEITLKWILHIRSTDFQRQISTYKFQFLLQ